MPKGGTSCIISQRPEKAAAAGGVVTLDDTRTRIIAAAIKAVRQYGLEGVRIQNVSELAGISAGAIYRHFEGKDQLLVECFTYVDKQAAAIFEHLKFNPLLMLTDPMGAVRALWIPYFRFWTSHPDETVFYHRFRDSTFFPRKSNFVTSQAAITPNTVFTATAITVAVSVTFKADSVYSAVSADRYDSHPSLSAR